MSQQSENNSISGLVARTSSLEANLSKRQSIVETMTDAFRVAEQIGQLLTWNISRFETFADSLTSNVQQLSAIATTVMQNLEIGVQQFDGFLKELNLTHERFGTVMFDLGWPTPNDIPVSLKRKLIDYYDTNGRVAAKVWAEGEMLNHYDVEYLRLLVELWGEKPLLRKRLEIVRAAVEAHCEGKYALSVPALLPQIEGLIAEGFAHHGEMGGAKYKTFVQQLMDPTSSLDYPAEIQNFVVTQLMANFQHGGTIAADLSRHAILHGGDTSYATQVKSLKCILLFHAIQDGFRIIVTPGGRRYHLVGCNRVMKLGQQRVYISSVFEQKLKGRSPCKYCLHGQPPAIF